MHNLFILICLMLLNQMLWVVAALEIDTERPKHLRAGRTLIFINIMDNIFTALST